MNTLKTIYDKLGKTELAKHEVELGLVQELETASKNNNDLANKLDTDFTKYFQLRLSIKSDLARLTSQNKEVNDKVNKALKAAKELGVDSPDLFKYAKYAQDINLLLKDITGKLNQ